MTKWGRGIGGQVPQLQRDTNDGDVSVPVTEDGEQLAVRAEYHRARALCTIRGVGDADLVAGGGYVYQPDGIAVDVDDGQQLVVRTEYHCAGIGVVAVKGKDKGAGGGVP